MRKQTFVVAACIAALVIPTLSWAEDTDQTRFYVGVKLGAPFWLSDPTEQVSARSAHEPTFDVVGGLNFGKHFGVELAYDYMETDLEVGGVRKIGEQSLDPHTPVASALSPRRREVEPLFHRRRRRGPDRL